MSKDIRDLIILFVIGVVVMAGISSGFGKTFPQTAAMVAVGLIVIVSTAIGTMLGLAKLSKGADWAPAVG